MSIEDTLRDGYQRIFGGEQNLSGMERALSTGLGLVLAAGGARQGVGVRGALMGAAGAALVARGMSGHCPLKGQVGGGQGGISNWIDRNASGNRYDREGVSAAGGRWHADDYRPALSGDQSGGTDRSSKRVGMPPERADSEQR